MWGAGKREPAPQHWVRWGPVIIVLHWATLLCVVALLVTGWQLGAHAAHIGRRTEILQLHASLGVLLLAATAVRILARLTGRRPTAPAGSRLRGIAALVVQAFLYLSLLALIATGIAAAAPRPFTPPIQLFGLWPLPKIVGALPTMVRNMPGIHAALVWILLGLVGFHVAAAIYGTLIARERTIFRMLVWPKHR